MKSKSELKAALEALQVKKPLRLSSAAPTFAPPIPPVEQEDSKTLVPGATLAITDTQVPSQTEAREDTSVALETGASPQTVVSTPTLVPAQTQVQGVSSGNQKDATTQISTETQVAQVAPVSVSAMVSPQTPVLAQTMVGEATVVSSPAPVATRTSVPVQTQVSATPQVSVREGASANPAGNQDSSVVLESQAAPKLHHGYTRLPNSILMRVVSGELVRSEIQILLLIARFTISFGRRHAPLSKAVLERQTGLRGPAVLQAVADLLAKGLIEKIPGDQYRPNLLGLKFDDEWDFFDKPKRPTDVDTSVATTTQVCTGTQVSTPSPAPVAVSIPAGVPAGTHFKDSKTIENKNSLSSLPEKLRDYFAELKPERKRESEWEAYETLRREYSDEDIADSLSLLIARGVGESGSRCHSPMAFLSKAIGDYVELVRSQRESARLRAEREQQQAEDRRRKEAEDEHERHEWEKKESAFHRTFPAVERQREVLAELCRGMPFRSGSEAGRTFAIGKWWEGLNFSEKQELYGE